MTPAISILTKHKVAFSLREYEHSGDGHGYGMEAADKLGLDPARVFKTLIVTLDNGALAAALVPVSNQLNLKRLAHALGAKKATMAEKAAVERSTGYVVGGVSPLGQRKRLQSVIDESVLDGPSVFVSGGRRGLDIELAPDDLVQLTGAIVGNIV